MEAKNAAPKAMVAKEVAVRRVMKIGRPGYKVRAIVRTSLIYALLCFALLYPALLCSVFITTFHIVISGSILLFFYFYLGCKNHLPSFNVEKDTFTCLPRLPFSIYLSLFLSNAPFSGIMTV